MSKVAIEIEIADAIEKTINIIDMTGRTIPLFESVNTPLSMHNENEGCGDCVVRIHYDERMTASEYCSESVGAIMCSIVDKVGKAFAVDATTVVRWMSESTFWEEWKMGAGIK